MLPKLSETNFNSRPAPVLLESEAMVRGRRWSVVLTAIKIVSVVALVAAVALPFFVNPLFILIPLIFVTVALGVGLSAKTKIREYKAVFEVEKGPFYLPAGCETRLQHLYRRIESLAVSYNHIITSGDSYACFETKDTTMYGVVYVDNGRYETRVSPLKHLIEDFVYDYLED